MARQGKFARLTAALKSEVNRRLCDGQGAPQILPWLNAQPDAIRLWEATFEGAPATPQNLSEWRLGGHKEWLAKRERLEDLKELGAYSLELVEASGCNIADGLSTIAAGQLMEVLENIGNLAITGGSEDAEADPNKGLAAITSAVAALRKGDRDREASARKEKELALHQERHLLARETAALNREKFETGTVEKFMEFAKTPRATAILNSGKSENLKMQELRALMFGPLTA